MEDALYSAVEDVFGPEKKKKAVEIREAAEREAMDMKVILATEEGKRVIWWLLEQAHIFTSNFAGQSNATIFREGERNIGLKVLNRALMADPNILATMLRSTITRNTEKERRNGRK